MIRGATAIARSGRAAAAAQAALDAGGSAADAVLAGFFANAGAEPGVLLAPIVVLVAGGGAGARVLDGRALQPGKGGARPRGFKTEGEIPPAAYVAVPRSLSLVTLLHGARGRATLSSLVKAGVAAAEEANAPRRAALLKRVGAAGPLALRSDDALSALLAAAGPVAGGILTAEDIESAAPDDVPARVTMLSEQVTALDMPWEAPADGTRHATDAILASDGRGLLAALAYAPTLPEVGVRVPELEIVLNRVAHPVRRGVTRTAPGTVLPMPAPIGMVGRSGGFWAAVALPGLGAVDPALMAPFAEGWPAESALAGLRERTGADAALALVRDARDARVLTA